jgi:hypothetical protein
MKVPLLLAAIAGMAIVASAPITYGQDDQSKHEKHHRLWEWLNALSSDEQAKLRAARKQALQKPEVRAADEHRRQADAEYHNLLQREMLRIDPSLKPLLDKVSDLRQHADF